MIRPPRPGTTERRSAFLRAPAGTDPAAALRAVAREVGIGVELDPAVAEAKAAVDAATWHLVCAGLFDPDAPGPHYLLSEMAPAIVLAASLDRPHVYIVRPDGRVRYNPDRGEGFAMLEAERVQLVRDVTPGARTLAAKYAEIEADPRLDEPATEPEPAFRSCVEVDCPPVEEIPPLGA